LGRWGHEGGEEDLSDGTGSRGGETDKCEGRGMKKAKSHLKVKSLEMGGALSLTR